MPKPIKIIVLIILGILLLLIRFFENEMFYDPLISFFKADYNSQSLPQLNTLILFANVGLRFLFNTIVSLGILWVVFNDKSILKLSTVLYLIFFVLLIMAFSYLVYYSESENFLALFYVRRFLIQPLFLLILIPAFYFQKLK